MKKLILGVVACISGCGIGLGITPGWNDSGLAPQSEQSAALPPSPTPTMTIPLVWVQEVAVPTSGDVRCFVVMRAVNPLRADVVAGWCGAELDLIGAPPVTILRGEVR